MDTVSSTLKGDFKTSLTTVSTWFIFETYLLQIHISINLYPKTQVAHVCWKTKQKIQNSNNKKRKKSHALA